MRGWVIGIDAGGTSVRAALADAEEGVVRADVTAAADPSGGTAMLASLLEMLRSRFPTGEEPIVAVCAGLAKVSRPGVAAGWQTALQAHFPRSRIECVPDYAIALHGAIPAGVGLVVAAGTGSVVYGENARHESARVGGRGWEYGDEGSGSWLTTELIRRTLRSLDGLESATPLTAAICKSLDTDEAGALGQLARQRADAEGRGFLVPLILEQARAGDDEARNLFIGAGGWLAIQARAAAQKLDFGGDAAIVVTTAGGLWQAGDLIQEPFAKVLRRYLPHVAIRAPDAEPLQGACRLALRLAERRVSTPSV